MLDLVAELAPGLEVNHGGCGLVMHDQRVELHAQPWRLPQEVLGWLATALAHRVDHVEQGPLRQCFDLGNGQAQVFRFCDLKPFAAPAPGLPIVGMAPLTFETDQSIFEHRAKKIDMSSKAFLSFGAELIAGAIDVFLAAGMHASAPVVGMLSLAGGQRAFRLRDLLFMFKPEVFFALLEVCEFGVAPRAGHHDVIVPISVADRRLSTQGGPAVQNRVQRAGSSRCRAHRGRRHHRTSPVQYRRRLPRTSTESR